MTDSVELLGGSTPWLLVLAHPGHELCAFHLLERVRPAVAVITDGSGSTGAGRLHETNRLLAHVGARQGPVFGALTDREAYAALMAAESALFEAQTNQLTDYLVGHRVHAVLADAAEGYNPVHDVCHWMARAAVDGALRRGHRVQMFEIDLIARPGGSGAGLQLTLDDEAFARKLAAVEAYQALAGEAQAAFERHGVEAFRTEFLRRVRPAMPPPASVVPYYEEVGESRVRSGRYTSVLRYSAHVKPILHALVGEGTVLDEQAHRSPHQ